MLTGDEGRRQAYLAALGVPLWAARHALPQALPAESLDYVPFVAEFADTEFYEEAVPQGLNEAPHFEQPSYEPPPFEPDVPPQRAPATPAPVQAREQRPEQPQAPRPIIDAPKPQQAVAEAPRAPVKPGADFPRFNFWLKTLPQGWQLVIALGDVPDLSAQEHMLLGQIEALLGGPGFQSPLTFRWPLSANPAIPRDPQSAREAVAAFLKRARLPDQRYLLLGDALRPFVEPALAGEKLASGDSLAALLAEPARKRELWQSLQGML